VLVAIAFIEQFTQRREISILEVTTAKHLIPNSDDLDRLLRYDAAHRPKSYPRSGSTRALATTPQRRVASLSCECVLDAMNKVLVTGYR
jgi:hypothetical protein